MPKASGYTKVIGALSTGVFLVVAGGKFLHPATAVEEAAQFDLVVDHTLDGTGGDNVECICDEGYEADATGQECQEIDPCSSDNTNLCTGPNHGLCENWAPPAEYNPGYNCACDYGYGNTNNEQECEPVPCEDLSIDFTVDCTNVQGVNPGESTTCICVDGYGPDSSFTMDCEGTARAYSQWFNEKSCLPVRCPNLDVENSNYDQIETTFVTTESATVRCDDGYELSTGGGCEFEAVCTAATGPNSHWLLGSGSPLPACVATACDSVSITNSDAQDQGGLVTHDTLHVTCNAGYESSSTGAFEYTLTCEPADCDSNEWTGVEDCVPSYCDSIYIANTELTGQTDFQDHVESPTRFIECASGFEPNFEYGGVCEIARDCDPVAPGNAAYSGSQTCERVVCAKYETPDVSHSASSSAHDGTQQQTDTCIDGYGTAQDSATGTGSYLVNCIADGPCARRWDENPVCVPVECPILFSTFSDFSAGQATGSVTGDTVEITCADGYETSTGSCTYTASCVGTAPNLNEWQHDDACQLVACPDDIDISFSTSSVTDEHTFDSTTVTCINGYWDASAQQGSFDLFCAPIPCANEWTGYRDCTPTPCPELTVANTDHTDVDTGADITSPDVTATCLDGYEPTVDAGGCSVLRTCSTAAPASAFWTGDASCNLKPCDDSVLENADRSTLTESDGFSATVTCDDGFASNGVGSYYSTCQPDAPCEVSWSAVEDCECVDCPLETFANSDRDENHISGCTEDEDTVNCNAGYCSSLDHSSGFTAVCTGTAPAEVEWQGLQTCVPSSCGILFKANSDTTSFVGSTGQYTEVRCNPGCHSNDCTSVIITCEAQAPCHSEWDHQDFECVCDSSSSSS